MFFGFPDAVSAGLAEYSYYEKGASQFEVARIFEKAHIGWLQIAEWDTILMMRRGARK